MQIILVSFGFSYGPIDAEYVVDLRFLQNPYWEPALRPFPGTDARIAEYVLGNEQTQQLLALYKPLLTFLCETWQKKGRDELKLALGCTGGRHRSVAVTEYLTKWLSEKGYSCHCVHRDIEAGQ